MGARCACFRICVSVCPRGYVVGLIVSFSESQLVTPHRPEPPRPLDAASCVRHWISLGLCALRKENQLWRLRLSPPRGRSHSAQVTLEVEDASPLEMIPG